MTASKQLFSKYYDELLHSVHDTNVSLGLSRSTSANRQRRSLVTQQFPRTRELAEEVRHIKENSVAHMNELVHLASVNLQNNGAKVYTASSAGEAREIVSRIVGSGKMIVSGKTLVGEEIELRHHLESLNNTVWETDVAQFIQQLRNEKPMHYVFPSLHVTREEVARLLTDLLGREIPSDVSVQVRTIREFLRNKYFEAHIGLSGCNVLAADTGSIFLIENEGNIRMATTVPPIHIVVVGIEKIVPTLEDAWKVASATWRYAGFKIPQYVSAISGPSSTADIENVFVQGSSGPLELHVVFLDNGRSTLAQDDILKEALYCIKCGCCLLECPIFQMAGGYFGGSAYFGGVGSILTAYLAGGLPLAAPIAYTCLRCGLCSEVCPVSIDTSRLIANLRYKNYKPDHKHPIDSFQ